MASDCREIVAASPEAAVYRCLCRRHKSTGQCSTVDSQSHLPTGNLEEAPWGIAASFVARCVELMRGAYGRSWESHMRRDASKVVFLILNNSHNDRIQCLKLRLNCISPPVGMCRHPAVPRNIFEFQVLSDNHQLSFQKRNKVISCDILLSIYY